MVEAASMLVRLSNISDSYQQNTYQELINLHYVTFQKTYI